MQFTHQTLISTSKRFNDALIERELGLPFTTSRNVWAQIVVGKDFSAAVAAADAQGHIDAVPITEEAIQAQLRAKSRQIPLHGAAAIFTSAVGDDLPALSPFMTTLRGYIARMPSTCILSVFSDGIGLGLLEAKHAGYLPVSSLRSIRADPREVPWLRASADLVAITVNALAGVSEKRSFEIFAASSRVGNEKEDQVFANYFGERIESCCEDIVRQLLASYEPALVREWDVDFDDVRNAVFNVFEQACSEGGGAWLKPECALGDATIDHLGARLRETLKGLSEQANDDEEEAAPSSSLMQTARLSMRKVLGVKGD